MQEASATRTEETDGELQASLPSHVDHKIQDQGLASEHASIGLASYKTHIGLMVSEMARHFCYLFPKHALTKTEQKLPIAKIQSFLR